MGSKKAALACDDKVGPPTHQKKKLSQEGIVDNRAIVLGWGGGPSTRLVEATEATAVVCVNAPSPSLVSLIINLTTSLSDPHLGHHQQHMMDGLDLDPAEYLATKRLGSLKWLVEPASSSAPPPKPVSPSPALPVHQCVCCEAQAHVLQHVAHFLTAEELTSFAGASRRLGLVGLALTPSGEVGGDAHRRCLSGPLVPPFALTTCANDETRTRKSCHHHTRARYVQQPLRTESNGHALYWLDMEKPQRILAAGGARGTHNENGHSSAASSMTGSNAQISSAGSNGRPASSKQRSGGRKENREATEQANNHQAQVHARLKRRAAILVASLAGGGVMVVFVVWQQSMASDPPNNYGAILLLAVYALLALACLGVGLWMWQMYSDRQRQTGSMTRRSRSKRRNEQQVGNGDGGRDEEEAQILLENTGNDYGSGREGP